MTKGWGRAPARGEPVPVEELVELVRDGVDVEEGFRRIYDRYLRLVERFLTHRGVPRHQTEDLTQETFVQIYTGLADFRGESSFEGWLLRIADNVWRKHRRGVRTQKRSAFEVSLDPDEPSDTAAGPLQQALDAEQRWLLRAALRGLPKQMRQCATLRLLEGLRYQEIAEALEISLDAVRVQLSRARKRLHRDLAERLENP